LTKAVATYFIVLPYLPFMNIFPSPSAEYNISSSNGLLRLVAMALLR
jgi:uncharacterized membrane protein